MNIYIAFYKNQQKEIEAETAYQAQQCAAEAFKVPRKYSYRVSVMLAQKDGKQVTHTPDF